MTLSSISIDKRGIHFMFDIYYVLELLLTTETMDEENDILKFALMYMFVSRQSLSKDPSVRNEGMVYYY